MQTMPYLGDDLEEANFGRVVYDYIQWNGWTVEQFGALYGHAVKQKPYTKMRVYQMIRNNSFPTDPERRWVIAKILQIPALYLGVEQLDDLLLQSLPSEPRKASKAPVFTFQQTSLDIEEFQSALSFIEEKYSITTATDSLKEIKARLRYLHDEALYITDDTAKRIRYLVCGYQMAAGNILRDKLRVDEAVKHLDKAVILAKESECYDLYVAALLRRGVLFLDRGKTIKDFPSAKHYFTLALCDFEEAYSYRDHAAQELKGAVLLLKGTIRAHMALDKDDLSKALKDVKEAERDVLKGSDKDKGIYYIDRASAYMASPRDALHDSTAVFEALDEARQYIKQDTPRRYVYLYITDAAAHFDKKWYPIATQRAEEALAMMGNLRSRVHIVRLANLHERLQTSSYGKDIKVAELGVTLLKSQYPGIFH
jgi:tetratricopeptide (TPR) repeat protein